MARKLAYLGPPGTFTEQAAMLHDRTASMMPLASVPAVAAAVDTGMADEGIAAIENSLDGSVSETLDLLIHESRLVIRKELVMPIEQCLLVKPGTQYGDIKAIFSHPQALGQCKRFLERCFPKAQLVAALSTTAAVEQMLSSSTTAAAIGNMRAAEIYKAQVLAQGIQDQANNVTRFVVLALSDHAPTGNDKTSLSFYIAEDRPGTLVEILQEFSGRRINLMKIESRPSKQSLGRYFFLVDLEGHRQDKIVAEALAKVKAKTAQFKIFGSYPRWTEKQG